ncbi:MAG TPA: ParB/RepB/Spo0J family partition protein [Anaerolineaceae bacterium]|nr:ParB/RepB/Spo0J family partition protein [Anaerolineaceae bacterium]
MRLDLIEPSKTNPRKRFDDAAIDELTASVARVGVLQPILVREHPENPIKFEIVAGERRWRAAQKAGLEYIPATIRPLTDLEALELQVLENLHRTDLHPLEEAEGFQQLLDANGYTVETLAEKVGKSKAAIYASLKLCALCPAGRDAFFEGKLTASTALLVARVPGATLQAKALKEITKPNYNGDIPSYRDASRIIRHSYMLDLDRAIFDQSDPTLRPGAGDCYSCEKRSGNCKEIYPDIDSADVCTDPSCFKTKRSAHIDKLSQVASTIKGQAAKELMPYNGHYVAGGKYTRADGRHGLPINQKQTWEELLGDELPSRYVIVEDRDPVKVVDIEAATRLLTAKGWTVEETTPAQPTAEQLEQEKRQAAKKAEIERRVSLLKQLHGCIGNDRAALENALRVAVPILLTDMINQLSLDHISRLFAVRGESTEIAMDDESGWDTHLRTLPPTRLACLLVEVISISSEYGSVFHLPYNWTGEADTQPTDFYEILRAAGINPEQSLETPPSPPSAAHAEIDIAREENPEPAAQAAEPVAQPEETHIEAAVPAAPRKRGRPRKQAVLTPAAEVLE